MPAVTAAGSASARSRRCWDLEDLARDYAGLVNRLVALPAHDKLARMPGRDALRLRIELVASYRTFPFRDPDLPAQLLPEGWPGRRAHKLFVEAHDVLAEPAEAYVRSVLQRHRS